MRRLRFREMFERGAVLRRSSSAEGELKQLTQQLMHRCCTAAGLQSTGIWSIFIGRIRCAGTPGEAPASCRG